jgi:outer membrane protein assembly factor BamB
MSKDGQQRWSRPLGGTSVEASILAGSNVVIVLEAARGGLVIALSQKTGEVAWKYAT